MIENSDEDLAFLRAFEDGTLPRSSWTHAAHIRMAWLQFDRHQSFEPALRAIREGIRRYNASVGSTGYHETVTVAFAILIWHRRTIACQGPQTWKEFADGNADLFSRTEPILDRYYSQELLRTPGAVESFVDSDLVPLPDIGPDRALIENRLQT